MLKEIADLTVYNFLGLSTTSKMGEAFHFFVYDTLKIFLLLIVIIPIVSYLRTYFPAEKTRRILSHKRTFIGNIMAALMGVVTPFCSCSAVPLFIGFVEAGVPIGITFSFLIASPMVNEIAVVLLYGLFGWKITAIYILTGFTVAILAGIVIGKLELERWVEGHVFRFKTIGIVQNTERTFKERFRYASSNTKNILRKIWLFIIIAIAIGGFIHGYVPEDLLLRVAGPDNPFAVPVAVFLGIPLYSNAAGIIPIVYALMEKGIGIGTVLAFMMAVTALSLPEMIILKKVLKPQLLGVFAGIMVIAIIGAGYLFNLIL